MLSLFLRLQAIRFFPISEEYLPNQWSPFSILEVFNGDKLLLRYRLLTFLYDTRKRQYT